MIDNIIMSDEAVSDGKISVEFDKGLPFGAVSSIRKDDGPFRMRYGMAGITPDRRIDPMMLVCGIKNIFRELYYVKKFCPEMDVTEKR